MYVTALPGVLARQDDHDLSVDRAHQIWHVSALQHAGDMCLGREQRADVGQRHDDDATVWIEAEIPEYAGIDGSGFGEQTTRDREAQSLFGIDDPRRLLEFDRYQ